MNNLNIDPLWCVVEDCFNIENNKSYEGIFSQGNGYMSTRGCLEEGIITFENRGQKVRSAANVTSEEPDKIDRKRGTYIPGITGIHPNVNEEMINLPWFIDFKIWFEGERLDMLESKIIEFTRWLDLRDGTLNRTFKWKTKQGQLLEVKFRRYLDMNIKNLCVQEIDIKSITAEGNIEIKSSMNHDVLTNGFNHFKNVEKMIVDNEYIGIQVKTDNKNYVQELSTLKVSDDSKINSHIEDYRISQNSKLFIKPEETKNIIKYTTVATNKDLDLGKNLQKKCVELLIETEKIGNKALYLNHKEAWNRKWLDADIIIEGDEKSQLSTRFSIYHLIRSNVEDDPRVSICAKGHAGEAYFGRYFWDTEIYMLPFYIYTNPKAAKNLLLFRYNTLDGARKNAESYNYKGARYPWESSITGEEQCHLWQFADNEIHVTADIIYGLWHYYSATDDLEFMINYGMEMLIETSRYWISRVDMNDGRYGFIGVMGPDEYTPFTNNNSFTNRMVKFNLNKTLELLEVIKSVDEAKYMGLIKSLNITDEELSEIHRVSEALKISYDPKRKLVLQSEDFEDLAEIDINGVWKDKTRHFIHFLTQEKLYRSKVIKQADVIALMNLFPTEFTAEEMSNAYDYYEPITTHDSSLSPSNHGIISSWLGKADESFRYFSKASQIDLNLESYSAAEGIHIANCGGVWQMIVFGFAGMESALWNSEITFSPKLPTNWKSIKFSVAWHGKKYKVSVNHENTSIEEVVDNIGGK